MLFFNSNVISILLYGCKIWKVNKNDMHKLDVFQTKCLRMICNISWSNKIFNEDLYRRANSLLISCQIQEHRMRWLGYVLRMSPDHIPRVALRWTPTGKKSKGRPKATWRRSIIAELSDMGLTMGETEVIAQECKRWRNNIGDEEDAKKIHYKTLKLHLTRYSTTIFILYTHFRTIHVLHYILIKIHFLFNTSR